MGETTFYPKRILAIHAHPDDVEILAGGTLVQLVRKGHHVTVATMTAGDCGTVEYSPEEIARIRRAEAAKGAARMGALDYVWCGFQDLAIFNDDASRRRVTEVMRRARPDIVITASPVDYHCDHEATSVLVRDCCFAVSAPNYLTGGDAPALDAIPHLYFCDPAEGRDRDGNEIRPDFVVDVAAQIDDKSEALAAHESQRNWLKRQHGMDNYIETMKQWCASRGRLGGYAYGEGFRQYKCHPYPSTPLLQQLLGL